MERQVLGLIPARGGSKRLPGKNKRMLGGKPLVCWTIEAALTSRLDRVVVSSDDNEIRGIALDWGAEIHRRPDWLSQDDSSPYDLARVIIREYPCTHVMLLQPTSPLRTAKYINAILSMDGVIRSRVHVNESKVEVTESRVEVIQTVNRETQEANGAIYCAKNQFWTDLDFSFDDYPGVHNFHMNPLLSIDIDTLEDFEKAASLL